MDDFEPLKTPYSGSRAAYHALIVHRIYHEDMLFAQRAYVLLAVHAFLMTAFTVLVSGQRSAKLTWAVASALGAFGALLRIFQAAFGRQMSRAIGFWREYARLIESAWDIPFDHLQYNFYGDAIAETPFGTMVKKDPAQRSLYQVFGKTRFLTSMVSTLGVIFPAALAVFWASVLGYALSQLSSKRWPGVVSLLVVVAMEVFALRPRLALATSEKSRPEARTD
jgi:hypothetical protein